MLILKQNAANTVPTPPAGKGTIFLDDSDTLSVKTSDGNVETFPTVAASNSQVVFMNGTALSGEAALTYDFNNNILNITGNVAAGNVKTDNLLYANGTAWDLSDPGGSNTEIQFNDSESFGGSAALTFNKSSNLVSMGGALSVTGNANVGNLGTAGQVIALGNVTGSYFIGNGSQLTGIDATAIQNGTANVRTFNNGNVTVSAAGTANVVVVTSTGANISGTANITGNANVGNLGTTGLAVSGNAIISGNLTVDGNLVYVNVETVAVEDPIIQLQTGPNGAAPSSNSGKDIGSALNYYNSQARVAFMGWDVSNAEFGLASEASITNEVVTFSTYGNLRAGVYFGNGSGLSALTGANVTGTVANATHASTANTVVDAAQPNITSVGTLTSLAVTGNANVGNIGGAAGVFTANVSAGNLSTGGTLNVTGNANVVNLGASGTVTVTGNASAGNLSTGGTLSVTGNGNLGNVGAAAGVFTSNVTAGNVNAGNLLTANFVTGTLTTAAQPNITSVGTLGNLSVTSNITAGNVKTDNLLYANGNPWDLSDPGGSNTQIQFNDDESFGGSAAFTFNKSSNAVTMSGNLTAGNANLGNLVTANVANLVDLNVSGNANIGGGSGGNISGANVIAANTFVGNLQGQVANGNSNVSIPAANGNINISAVGTANVLVVTGTGVNVAGTLNATGNANVGNLGATGVIATTLGGSLTTSSQPNITSVGTLTSLAITGNATAGNVYANSGTVGASLLAGALTTSSQPNITSVGTLTSLTVTGNVSAGNVYSNSGTIGASLLTGTLTTAAQPNITSVGTLSSLAVTANGTFGNVYANAGTIGALTLKGEGGNISNVTAGNITGQVANALVASTVYTNAQPNITSVGTLSSLAVTANVAAGNLTTTGVLSVTGTGVSSIAGNLDMTSNTIINLATPSNPNDAATKQYVDDVAQGLNIHDSCQAATPNTLANVTSGTITYNNGTAGVGANLVTTGSFNLIDGVNVQTSGTRILVKNEANTVHNGIYTWANSTTIVRATDYNSVPEVEAGDFTFITGGTLYDNTGWVQTSSPAAIGGASDFIEFTQFSGAGTYQAGTGLTLTGPTFSVNASQSQITSVGTLSFLGVDGNLTAANVFANTGAFYGNGSGLSDLAGGNVTGQVANALVAGTVYTAAQPNITSVGTLSSLDVSGTITASNVTANTGIFTGNGSGLSAIAGANVTGTVSSATTAGTVTTAAQPNITSVGTLSSLSSSGNITAPNLIANTGMFISSVNAAVSAAGTVQGDATALTTQINVVSTVASGAGVRLPTAVAGMRVTIMNTAANALAVYPATSGIINSAAANAAFSQAAGSRLDFVAVSTTTQWYTLNATYA